VVATALRRDSCRPIASIVVDDFARRHFDVLLGIRGVFGSLFFVTICGQEKTPVEGVGGLGSLAEPERNGMKKRVGGRCYTVAFYSARSVWHRTHAASIHNPTLRLAFVLFSTLSSRTESTPNSVCGPARAPRRRTERQHQCCQRCRTSSRTPFPCLRRWQRTSPRAHVNPATADGALDEVFPLLLRFAATTFANDLARHLT
jgi:hypothetical protein